MRTLALRKGGSMRAVVAWFVFFLLCNEHAIAKELTKATVHEYVLAADTENRVKAGFEYQASFWIENVVLKDAAKDLVKKGVPEEKAAAIASLMRASFIGVKDRFARRAAEVAPMSDLEEKVYLPILRERFSDEELREV